LAESSRFATDRVRFATGRVRFAAGRVRFVFSPWLAVVFFFATGISSVVRLTTCLTNPEAQLTTAPL